MLQRNFMAAVVEAMEQAIVLSADQSAKDRLGAEGGAVRAGGKEPGTSGIGRPTGFPVGLFHFAGFRRVR